jgi:hypothetical protein
VFSTTGFTRDVKNKFSSFKTLEEPLKLVVEKYLKNGYKIYGPYKVDKIVSGKAYLYVFSGEHVSIDLFSSKQINEKEKTILISKDDKVYLLKKDKEIVLLKLKKGVKDDY